MKQHAVNFLMVVGLIGCKDNPYSERAAPMKKNELSGVIISPTHQAVLSSNSFRDGVSVKAAVSSDMPLNDCQWRIEPKDKSEEHVLSGQGIIDGVKCNIEEPLDGEKFSDGAYTFKVHAEDTAGLKLSDVVSSFQVFKEVPDLDIIWPGSEQFLAQDHIRISGTLNNAKDIREVQASFHGVDTNNHHLKGNVKVIVKNDETKWEISLGEKLIDGEYALELLAIDIHGNERHFPTRNLIIDKQAPIIMGALDGIAQNIYTQETRNYHQQFIDTDGNPRYVIEPIGEASAINWQKTPTIYRWLTKVNDRSTAPSYSIEVSDITKLKQVQYKLSAKCASLNEADTIATSKNNKYEIRFTQDATDIDLTQNSEKFCLSIWAIDQAGNASNHKVEFFWKVIASPLGLDANAARYRASMREDDISWVGPPVWKLFRNRKPMALKKDLVIAHVIISNPFAAPLSAKLELSKSLELKISKMPYFIPANNVDIRYFAYDLIKNEVGVEKTLNDGSTIIRDGETIVAKFILAKEAALNDIENPDDRFWQNFSLRVGFSKIGHDKPMIDGLKLITRDSETGTISAEFVVPWGDGHNVRRRSAPLVVAPN